MHVTLLATLKEIALVAQGQLAVAQCHLQLAQQRVQQDDRIAHDHLDTSMVFTDSAAAVIATIHAVIQRAEQGGRDSRADLPALSSTIAGAA